MPELQQGESGNTEHAHRKPFIVIGFPALAKSCSGRRVVPADPSIVEPSMLWSCRYRHPIRLEQQLSCPSCKMKLLKDQRRCLCSCRVLDGGWLRYDHLQSSCITSACIAVLLKTSCLPVPLAVLLLYLQSSPSTSINHGPFAHNCHSNHQSLCTDLGLLDFHD